MATAKVESSTQLNAAELHIDEENQVIYRIMQPEDVPATLECSAEAFMNGEPLTQNLKTTLRDWKNFVMMWLPRMAEEGNSVVAVHTETGKFLGAFINEDFNNPDPDGIESFLANSDGHWGPVMEIIGDMEEQFMKQYNVPHDPAKRPAGKHFHMWMIGVPPANRGRGIGRQLFVHSCAWAKARGFQVAFAECASSISTHLMERYLGAKTEYFVDYATWNGDHSELVNTNPKSGHKGASFMTVDLASFDALAVSKR